MAVGGGHEGAVRQKLESGISAVRSQCVVHEADPVLPLSAPGDIVPRAHPADPVALGGAFEGRVPEGRHDPAVGRVPESVPVAGQAPGQFARLGECLSLVAGEHDVRVPVPVVLTHEHGDRLSIGRADHARLAEPHVGTGEDRFGLTPRQAAIRREGLVNLHFTGGLSGVVKESAIVVKERHVMSPLGECDHVAHGDDTAEVADRFELAPAQTVVAGDRHTDRVEARKHDQPFLSGPVYHTIDGGHFHGGRPALWRGQPLGPGQSCVSAALHHDRPATVALGIDADHGLVVLEEHRGRVAEVLAFVPVDHNLPLRVRGEVDGRNRVPSRLGRIGRHARSDQ